MTKTTKKCNRLYIDNYLDDIEVRKIPAPKEIHQAIPYIRENLAQPGVIYDQEKTEKAVELIERYFEFKLMPWELLILALVHCYMSDGTLLFDTFLLVIGRGCGKNGFIAALAWYLTTHYHGIKGYNVDIVANSQDQAKTSFDDIHEVLEATWSKSRRFFYKTKEIIRNLRTKSYIKFNTSKSETKDGKRSACLVFDEVHEYKVWDLINVFRSGFGKRKHSRIFYITTQGRVRAGVLDELLELSEKVLTGEVRNLRMLPLIFKLDHEDEKDDPAMWVKPCPSLPYLPELQHQMEQDYELAKHQPSMASEFMTKRMNLPAGDAYVQVAPWPKVLATNQEVPDLTGAQCIGAVDYAQITDFCFVGLLFKRGGKRYWLGHTFVCDKALKIESRPIKAPIDDWKKAGLVTVVNDVITPDHIVGWFLEQVKDHHILTVAADDYRFNILQEAFEKSGLPLEKVRSGPVTHAKIAPVIELAFAEETLVFGDDPVMRWYVSNTKVELDGKGNQTYLKIEPKTRKTDGFFALIHALVKDELLVDSDGTFLDLDVYTY